MKEISVQILNRNHPILRKIYYRLPKHIRIALESLRLLEIEYGHMYSSKEGTAIDKHSSPIPWFTYPAIEYIKNLDLSDKVVFEYGTGNSTLFWGTRSKKVIGIEHAEEWYQKVLKDISKNAEMKLIKDDSYAQAILEYDEDFDVIVIDGDVKFRYDCAVAAVKKLKPGGMIILDNSDWLMNTTEFLRKSNLIQVDMSGFAPINSGTHTTSFFLHREFDFKPINNEQPQGVIGSMKNPFKNGDIPLKAYQESVRSQ